MSALLIFQELRVIFLVFLIALSLLSEILLSTLLTAGFQLDLKTFIGI